MDLYRIMDVFSKYPTLIFVTAVFGFLFLLWLISAIAALVS